MAKGSNFQSNQARPDYPYWCSFRDPLNNFVGVVICRGTSPGAAANSAIVRGIVEAEQATIILLSELHYALLSKFTDRLLDETSAMLAAEAGGFAHLMKRVDKVDINKIDKVDKSE